MKDLTERLLDEWSDPLGSRTMSDAEDLIHMLLVEIAGKEEIIKALETDIQYYKSVGQLLINHKSIEKPQDRAGSGA